MLNFEEFLNEGEKWMQKAFGSHPGALHKKLKVPEDKDIPMTKINAKLRNLKKKEEKGKLSAADLKLVRQLNAAKTSKKIAKNK